jgi:hypothetical protein
MAARMELLVMAALACASLGARAAERTVSILNYPRPVLEAASEMSLTYEYDFTYEDPILVYPGDLQERDPPPDNPMWRTRGIMVLKPGSIRFRVPRDRRERPSGRKLFGAIVQAGIASGREFKVEETDGVFHLIPTFIRDVSGRRVPYPSLLDRPMTFDAGDRTVDDVVRSVVKEITRGTNLDISVGATAFSCISNVGVSHEPSLFSCGRSPMISLGALNRPAREVLTEALRHLGLSWRLIWREGNSYRLETVGTRSRNYERPGLRSAAGEKK